MTVEMRIGLVHQFIKVVMHVTMRFLCTGQYLVDYVAG